MSWFLPQPLAYGELLSRWERTDERLRAGNLSLALVEILGGVALLQSEVSFRSFWAFLLLLLG